MEVLDQLKEQLTSFGDACKIEGLDPDKVIPSFEGFPEKDRLAMQGHAKWVIIVKAANRIGNKGNEFIPDFNDRSTYKYEIWWSHRGGSRGFRYDDYGHWDSASVVGSRLCFISREVAKYVAEQFEGIWDEYAL